MNISQALEKLTDAMRLRHLARSTEVCYRFWLEAYMGWLSGPQVPGDSGGLSRGGRVVVSAGDSAEKVEAFLTMQARRGVAASTQNQAFSALVFFYKEVLKTPLEGIDAARVRRPERVRTALSVEETRRLLGAVEDWAGYPTRLLARLLYGCGLRVCEPLELRMKDVKVGERTLTIREAKGGRDRTVALPECLVAEMEAQLRTARAVWRLDAAAGVPVSLPGLLARKSPRLGLTEAWAWVFPAHETVADRAAVPDARGQMGDGKVGRVRWRMHEKNLQRAVRAAAAMVGLAGKATPHVLRHCYATHAHRAGAAARDLQEVLGHRQLETTMRYLAADAGRVRSPLEVL